MIIAREKEKERQMNDKIDPKELEAMRILIFRATIIELHIPKQDGTILKVGVDPQLIQALIK